MLKATYKGHLVQTLAQSRANFAVRSIHRRIKLAEGLYDTGRIITEESMSFLLLVDKKVCEGNE